MTNRVIHLTYDYIPRPIWGVGWHIFDLVKSLNKKGTHSIVATRNPFNLPQVSKEHDAMVIRSDHFLDSNLVSNPLLPNDAYIDFDLTMSWNLRFSQDIINYLSEKRISPEVVHNHGWMTWMAAKRIADFFRIPIVSSYHFFERQYAQTLNDTTLIDAQDIYRIEDLSLAQSNKIILFSKSIQKTLYEYYSVPHKKNIRVVTQGIDLTEVQKYKSNQLQKSKKGKINILFVGRLVAEKGIEILLPIAQKICKENPYVFFSIAGSGPGLHRLKKKYAGSKISFLGHISKTKLYEKYANTDILCHPSLTETFGLVLAEAMAFGIPVVTTYGHTMPNYVVNEKTGLLVKLNYDNNTIRFSQESLYRALKRLIKDADLRDKIGRNCSEYSRLHFSSDLMAERILEVYNETKQSFNT